MIGAFDRRRLNVVTHAKIECQSSIDTIVVLDVRGIGKCRCARKCRTVLLKRRRNAEHEVTESVLAHDTRESDLAVIIQVGGLGSLIQR